MSRAREEKVAIVTGAAGGIGAASAVRLAQDGCAVVCVDLDEAGAAAVAQRIEAAGGRARSLAADVSSAAGNRATVELARSAFGGLDVLLANAAVQRVVRLEETTDDDWDALLRTNLQGVGLGVAHALPALRERGGGSVILTASVLGIAGDPDLPAYGATKGALRALCRSLAAAHGPENVRVNTVCPGDVETPMLREFFGRQADPEAARRRILERYPLGRFAAPEDVANVVAFLASDDAAYVTGTDVCVDGGLLAAVY